MEEKKKNFAVNFEITEEQKLVVYEYAHNKKQKIKETFSQIIDEWIEANIKKLKGFVFNPAVKDVLKNYEGK